MELIILFGVFTLLMLIGTPIAFCLGIASFATILYMGLPPLVVFQRMNSCADSRLAYMKPIRGADKVSTRNNRQKGSSELCVHRERLFVSDL